MNFCTECGHKIEAVSNFCPDCGFELKPSSAHAGENTYTAGYSSSEPFIEEFHKLLELLIENDLDFWVIGIERQKAALPPFIQASQENIGWLTEVSSEKFTNPPLNSQQTKNLIDLNFLKPDQADQLHYWRKETDTSVIIEKYTEVFFEIFEFDGKESIFGTTPDTSLANFIQRYYSRDFKHLKFVEEY